MRAEAIAHRLPSKPHNNGAYDTREGLMTPARKAGLDALERELNDFLKRQPGEHAAAA
jgi:hypothetical protein